MSDHFRLTGSTRYASEAALIQLDRHTAADIGNVMSGVYAAYADDHSISDLGTDDLTYLLDLATFREAMSEVQGEQPYLFNDNVKHPLTQILDAMARTEVAKRRLQFPEAELKSMARELLFDEYGIEEA